MAQNSSAAVDALKTSFEQLAASIAAPAVQAIAPTLVWAAQGIQTVSNAIGGLNPNVTALGSAVVAAVGGFYSFKALFGMGGSLLAVLARGSSAVALDASAAELSAAAVALGGRCARLTLSRPEQSARQRPAYRREWWRP